MTIAARTATGTGLVVALTKAHSHLMLVWTAITEEWPMTAAEAAAEATEVQNHLDSMLRPSDLISPELDVLLQNWDQSIRDLVTSAREAAREQADRPIHQIADGSKETIGNLVESTWQLLAQVDIELTGLPTAVVEPGSAP